MIYTKICVIMSCVVMGLYCNCVVFSISQILSDMYIQAGVLQEVEEIMQQYLQSAQGHRYHYMSCNMQFPTMWYNLAHHICAATLDFQQCGTGD